MRPILQSIIWLVTTGFLIGWLYFHLHVVNGISQFMPAAEQDLKLQALMSEMQSGPAASTLMLRLGGADSIELARLSKQLRQALVAQREVFQAVRNNHRSVDLGAFASLFRYRYLLSDTEGWSESVLRETFQQRLSDLRSGGGALPREYLTTDPQLIFMSYLQGLFNVVSHNSGPRLKHGVWFDEKLESALMLVHVRGDSLDLDMMQRAQNEIYRKFSQLVKTASVQLEISGPGIMAVESRAIIEQVVNRLSIFMIILLVIVFSIAYRSLRLLLLAVVPLLTAIIVALVTTQLIFNEVHGIVLAFGITLLGVCLDYPLHFFSHLRTDEKPFLSLKRIWPTLLLSGFSSVLAYLALLGSGFDGLSQLAVFAASGLTAALLTTRYILPLLIAPGRVKPRYWVFDICLSKRQKTLLALFFFSAPVWIIMQAEVVWETSVDAISPVPVSARERDGKLRHELNVPEVSHVFIQSGKNLEEVLQATEYINGQLLELQSLGTISSIWSPSNVLPSVQRQKQRQRALPLDEVLSENLSEALRGMPFRRSAFDPWLEAVAESRSLRTLDYTTVALTPLASVLRQGLFQQQGVWISMTRISGIRSDAELNRWLDEHPDMKKSHVEIKRATERLLIEYRISTFERFLAVVALLVLIIFLWSRSLQKTMWIILPVSIGVLSGFSMPLLSGTAINVFHLLALLLVLGMGLDYSLFFNQAGEDEVERKQCVHAISISALSTSAAFLMLAFSSIPVMVAMGQTVAGGGFMCFISAWALSASVKSENKD
ncbi:hypothetical protein MNBD_GAMMA11-3043 [hydrothermal vent metagenome]|uniref:Membrane transport protein MMPL domain-containing protein n=1 Tax=hydrothermal vent metagenome TaxID=652676 RepID=A0A3B0XMN2_9ZZZZ